MKRIIFALLAVSASFAACDFTSESFEAALPIISAALLLSVTVSAIAYMAGSIMRDARLLVFSKDELFHTIVSALLVVSIQSIFVGACLITSGVLGGDDPLSHSISYLRAVKSEGSNMLSGMMRIFMRLRHLNSLEWISLR
jgi:Na+-driven multidrug efflux pump